MRSTRSLFLLLLSSSALTAVIAACTGEDPAPASQTLDGGGGTPTPTPTPPGSGDGGTNPGDDSGATDAGADVFVDAGYDVRGLSGLKLWLESTKDLTKASVGNDMVSWKDSSGHLLADGGVHTAFPIPNNIGGAINPSIVNNSIAGRPALSFDNVNVKAGIANDGDFDFGTGEFVIASVAQVTTASAGQLWRLMQANTAPSGTQLSPGDYCNFMGAQGAQPQCTAPQFTPNTTAHVFLARHKPLQAIFRVDGVTRGTFSYATDPNVSVPSFQQQNVFIGGNLTGQMAELVVVIGPMSDADVDALETYLKGKYQIP